jgi:flagellar hook-associated protein 1 FlgK
VSIRDTKIDSYIESMNTLMGELTWQVNSLHAEGVGLSSVSEMTGTVRVSAATDDLASAFHFSDWYTAGGTFDIQVFDASGAVVNTYHVDPAGSTVGDLITEINALSGAGGGEITAGLTADGRFQITSDATHTFAITPSTTGPSSNALAVLGVNSFFTWSETVGLPMDDITETIGVNDVLEANPNLISSGYLDDNGQVAPGGNDVARAIFNLQDRVVEDMGGIGVNSTMDTYYSSLVAQVGVDVQNTVNNEKFNDTLLGQYIRRKESITGVSLDEEMSELLKYQHLYQAAAKLISIADEMMESLISIK